MKSNTHVVGIKGVGMTALALILQRQGHSVTGSDTGESFVTDQALREAGIPVYNDFRPEHITEKIDRVIYSGAYHPEKNPELIEAIELDIPVLTQQEALADLVQDKKLIAVAGVGGKTTTAAMITHILKAAGKDVGYFIGAGKVGDVARPGDWGNDDLFVAEADEYANSIGYDNTPKFLMLKPTYTVITNISHDHPDLYKSEKETRDAFTQFAGNTKDGGTLYVNADDQIAKEMLKKVGSQVKKVTVGTDETSDWRIARIRRDGEKTHAMLVHEGREYNLELMVFADYNVRNAVQAAAVASDQGIGWNQVKDALRTFKGVGRRQEFMGEVKGIMLYDDYAHHPLEIQVTIQAFKQHFPDRELWVLFESHTFTRTMTMQQDFLKALALADKVSVMPIFSSAREDPKDFHISNKTLARMLQAEGVDANALSFDEAPAYIKSHAKSGDIILTMGAGKVWQLHDRVKEIL